MTQKISQRAAVRLKRRVKELEDQVYDLNQGRGGVRIGSWTISDVMYTQIKTARTLGYITLVSLTYSGTEVELKAIKL